MDAIRFGKFIAELRKENHMTQLQLAEKLHVTDKAVSRWEVSIIAIIFLIDNMGWLGFCGVCIPVICLSAGIILLVTAFYRRNNKLPCLQTLIFAIVLLLLVPVILPIMLFLIGTLGIGPVPN